MNAPVAGRWYARLLAEMEFGIGLPKKNVAKETQVRNMTEKIRISNIKFRQNFVPMDKLSLLFILSLRSWSNLSIASGPRSRTASGRVIKLRAPRNAAR